ncbi:MAG: histidine kinase [Chitinophagaceae bacterium]
MTKRQKILFHAGIWYFLLFFEETINLNFSHWNRIFSYTFALVCIVLFYSNYFFLFPRFFKKGKYIQWTLYAAISMMLCVGLRYLLEEKLGPVFAGRANYQGKYSAGFYIRDNLHFLIYFLVASMLVCAIEEWLRNKEEKNELIIQSKNAELLFLRSQINPHFLFNSLHNIYTLSYKGSEAAPGAILKLSGIMRYMLEESMEDKVLLTREIEYLQDYISLQELRFKGGPAFSLQVSGDVKQQRIAPLLLISFIENMFKHGEMNERAHPAKAHIEMNGNELLLITENKIKLQHKDKGKGIGMQNVQRRLQLLYHDQYELQVTTKEGFYYNSLKLVLQ